MEKQPIILIKTYDFLKIMLTTLKHFPKNQKFLLGDKIQTLTSDILELLIEAYYSPTDAKKDLLNQTNIKLEILRYYLRLCYELGFYNSKKYKFLFEKVQEIGKMNGGWLKSLR